MGKANKELLSYIRACLNRGYSFSKIEQTLIDRGYSRKIAEGIILGYKYRGNIFKWLTVFSLAIMFVLSVFLSGTGIIGMVTVNYKSSYVNNLGLIINETSFYTWYPIPKGEVISAAMTGNLIGEGTAKIYIENLGQKYLIFDSTKKSFGVTDVSSSVLDEKIKKFDVVCEESCELEGFNKSVYNLVFEVEDAILEVESINFDLMVGKEVESVPVWTNINDQSVNLGSELDLELSSFFNSSEDARFRYLAEDDTINISIVGDAAIIKPNRKGISHLYFIAEVNGVMFVSNLVEVDVLDTNLYGEKVDTFVKGPVSKTSAYPMIEKKAPSKFTPLLFIVVMIIILTLAIVPSRFYDITNLATKIDSMRKTGRISSSIKEYNQMKDELRKKDLSDLEKEKLMSRMESKIRSVSRDVPKLKIMKDFNEKCDELEGAILGNSESAQMLYSELRSIYLRLIEGKLRDKDKKIMYHRMQKYYKKLKKH